MTRLDRYVENSTLKAVLLVSAGLTTLFSLLAFVTQLHDVGKGEYRLVDAVAYVLLTAPERLLQLMPVSILLGTLFGLGSLASHNELTVMRAVSISPRRIVAWVFKLTGVILVILFLIAQFVIPPAERFAETLRVSKLSLSSAAARSGTSFWAESGHQYLNVRRFEHGNVPSDIYIYKFTDGGRLESFIRANRAEVRPDGTWHLTGVLRRTFSPTGIETEHVAALRWRSFLRRELVPLMILPPRSLPPLALYRYVRDLERRHQPAARYSAELWAKINIPLAMAAMILIAVPFVFGPLRTRGTGQRIVVGALIGIVFTLLEQISSYFGLLRNLNPAVMTTLPSWLMMGVALYLIRRAMA